MNIAVAARCSGLIRGRASWTTVVLARLSKPVLPAVSPDRGRVQAGGVESLRDLCLGKPAQLQLHACAQERRQALDRLEQITVVLLAQDGLLGEQRELTSPAADGTALTGSVLQQVVERIAAVYADRGLFGTRIDIRQKDVDRLIDRAGPLVVYIRPNVARSLELQP